MSNEKVFYHVSLRKNESSIMTHGLKVSIGDLSSSIGESIPAIYLFNELDDMNNALMNWLGEELDERYGEDCPIVIFKITYPHSVSWINKKDPDMYETIQYDDIPPEYIEVLRYE